MFFKRELGLGRLVLAGSVLSAAAFLAACGGGSDDDSTTTANFAGTYSVTASKTVDSCATGAEASYSGTTVVQQSGNTVSIGSGSTAFTGQVTADGSLFQATNVMTSNGVPVTSTIAVARTTTENVFSFALTISASAGSTTCVVKYQGTANKTA